MLPRWNMIIKGNNNNGSNKKPINKSRSLKFLIHFVSVCVFLGTVNMLHNSIFEPLNKILNHCILLKYNAFNILLQVRESFT